MKVIRIKKGLSQVLKIKKILFSYIVKIFDLWLYDAVA